MTNTPFIPASEKAGEFVVQPPRPTDAVGQVLRGVFDGGLSLPDDMAMALNRIDLVKH